MKRVNLILECSAVMLLCAAGECLAHLWKQQDLTWHIAAVAMIVPVTASALFFCVSVSVPELYAVGAIRFPLNLTLPTIFISLILLVMTLVSRVGIGIARLPEGLDSINVWANGWVITTTLVAAILCLTALSALGRDQEPPSQEAS